jgi:hypothetical protein
VERLLDTIRSVAARVKKHGERRLGEQNTKAALVEPLLEALGWDIREPDEVHREYKGKPQDCPVDYALKFRRKPRLFLEAKGLGEILADRRWVAQVLGYATVAGVEWCVLTDGNEYRFYNATASVDAEEKLLHHVRLTDVNAEEAARWLGLISRANLEQNRLDVLWMSHFVDRRVRAALLEKLTAPNRTVIRMVMERAPKLTSKQITDSIRRMDIRIDLPPALPQDVQPKADGRGRSGRKGKRRGTPKTYNVELTDLLAAGVLRPNQRLTRRHKGQEIEAVLLPDGKVSVQGKPYASCSMAAQAALAVRTGQRRAINGWDFWQFSDEAGKPRTLSAARGAFLASREAGPGPAGGLRLAGGATVQRA